jgi:5-(carboxyamino)imidazole ribonucleotide synthase
VTIRPILPPSTIGVLGGGQLGRYALIAARQMGYRTVVLEPDAAAPAGAVADEHLVAPYDDPVALDRLAVACDVVTTEFENPPAAALERLAGSVLVAPSPAAIAIAQDRAAEKAFLTAHGFPVGPVAVLGAEVAGPDLADRIAAVGTPAIVKTCRLGYDGKGQRTAHSAAEVLGAWADLGGVPCVVERRLDLLAELSVIVARTAGGDIAVYDVADNEHVDGILDLTVVPARVSPAIADRAVGLASAVADALDFVGVLAVELFVVAGPDGAPEVLVNELAPRPHNSGHWTLDAARTDQFEQQVRAVCGLALGPTTRTAEAVAMVNLLGDRWAGGEPRWEAALGEPGVSLHLYGKAAPRPGRKMGHLTVTGRNGNEVAERARQVRAALTR